MSFCIPYLFGVPGLAAPPKWWKDATGLRYNGTPKRTEIDDPRWRGAANRGFGIGTNEEVTFRAGYHVTGGQTSLFLSWHVKFDGQTYDPSGVPDRLWVGLEPQSGGGSPFVLRIDLPHNALEDWEAETPGPMVRRPLTFRDSDSPVPSTPDWVNNYTRVWRKVITTSPFKQEWAIHMMVPINPTATTEADDDGVNLNLTNFKLWFAVDIDTPQRVDGTTGGISGGGILRVNWPAGASILVSGSQINIPSTGTWETYTLGAVADPSCSPSNGLSLDYLNVGTMNTPQHVIKFSPSGPANPSNKFFARPANNSGANVVAHQVKAIFKIANWGSDTTPPDLWTEIPHTGDIDNKADINNGQTAVDTNQIEFDWTVGDPFLPKLRNARWNSGNGQWEAIDNSKPFMGWHQCIYVKLSGAGLVFTKDSVYRNMDFSPMSRVERGAELRVAGLKSISATKRDVYLMLEKINMPVQSPSGYDEGKFLESTVNRLIQEGHGESILAAKLRKTQNYLNDSQTPSVDIQSITVVLEEYLALFDYVNQDSGKSSLHAFISSLDQILNLSKQNDVAAKLLSNIARSMAVWLEAIEMTADGKKLENFVNALKQWLSDITQYPEFFDHEISVVQAMRTWLMTLLDKNRSFGRLAEILVSLEEWLSSDRVAAQLPEILDQLRKWLSSVDSNNKKNQQVFSWFGNEISQWLLGKAERLSQLVGIMSSLGFTTEELDQVFPTFRVHVYYDTGERWQENGKTYAILGLMPSFGFYGYHEGRLDGWQTNIKGATRVADNLYVVSAPTDGSAYISTIIQAVEPGEERLPDDPIKPVIPEKPCGCLCQIFKIFSILKNKLMQLLKK